MNKKKKCKSSDYPDLWHIFANDAALQENLWKGMRKLCKEKDKMDDEINMKPFGLWLSIGDGLLTFLKDSGLLKSKNYKKIKVCVPRDKLIVLRNKRDALFFHEKYGVEMKFYKIMIPMINWTRARQDYPDKVGLVLAFKPNFDVKSPLFWLNSWEVPSVVLWDSFAVCSVLDK